MSYTSNQHGFIDYYNSKNPTAKYGSAGWKAKVGTGNGPMGSNAPASVNSGIEAQYNQAVGDSDLANNLTHTENLYQQGKLSQEYGIDDASNPFSKMKMLQQSFERGQANTATGFASQGQYFSGAYNSNKKFGEDNYKADQDSLHRAYDSSKHDLEYSNTQSDAAATSGKKNAALQKLLAYLGLPQ